MSAAPQPHRVVVTGASGFVGSWLVKRLHEALPSGTKVVGLNHQAAVGGSGLDITDREAVDAFMESVRPTAVVHLAAISSPGETIRAGRRAWDVNLFGTMNVAEAVLRHAPGATFVYASSSEAYGFSFNQAAGGALDETAPLAPRSPYAATKAAADLLLGQMAANGLRVVRFRPFNHTGPGQDDRFVVPAFASQIAAIERGKLPPVIKVGNLDAQRDFLDVRDVVEAYEAAITNVSWISGAIFNLASGAPRRIGDILQALLAMSSSRIDIEVDATRLRPDDTPLAVGNATRAAHLFGWRPQIAWDVTLRHVLNFHRRQHEHAGCA